MKVNKEFTGFLVVLTSALLLAGCGSANKKTGSKADRDIQYVLLENNEIVDPENGGRWTYFSENPTTFYRFKLNNTGNTSRLPTINELTSLLQKVQIQLSMKKDPGSLASVNWFSDDCDFLASTSVRTEEGEVFYEVVHWDAGTKSATKTKVTGGDLVYVLLFNTN